VPGDHLVRRIDGVLDTSWVHRELASKGGRGVEAAVLQWNQIILIPHGNDLSDRARWNRCCKGQNDPNAKGALPPILTVSGDKECGNLRKGKNLFSETLSLGKIHFDCATDRMRLCPPPRAAPKPPPRAGSD